MARADKNATGQDPPLQPEQLVTAYRDAREAGDADGAEVVLQQILGKHSAAGTCTGGYCEKGIQRAIRARNLSPDDAADFRSQCYERILHALNAPRPGKALWEQKFSVALFGAITEVRRKRARAEKRDRQMVDIELALEVGEEPTNVARPALDGTARLIECLDALPPKVRRAAFLCWEQDLRVESVDPNETTAATVLGVSGRTVRNYLNIARKHVSEMMDSHSQAALPKEG